jgi:DNA-binding HxlR family transcriptional regulator
VQRTSFASMECSVARTLDVVGEWWTLLVLRDCFSRVRRFEDFQKSLGIARNVLADRLQTLVDNGILERRQYQERPDRHEYRLTQKGLDLYPVLVSLMRWGDRWAFGADPAPVQLTHKACGHDVMPVLVCPGCHEEVDARAMSARPRSAGGVGLGAVH